MATRCWHSQQRVLDAINAIDELRTYRLVLDAERRRLRTRFALRPGATTDAGTQALLRAQELELCDKAALLEELIGALAASFDGAD